MLFKYIFNVLIVFMKDLGYGFGYEYDLNVELGFLG